ncbi:porin [Sulfurivirga sp.]|uniref:porin n=1 Tax=Sulfurivirga sp. TaxID=2614236 RepID=UPI0025E6FF0F|nr:porin [Sulfurivirga sp.]
MLKIRPIALATLMTLGTTTGAQAANWLVLQGTEAPGTAKRAHVWGFIQFEYSQIDNKKIKSTVPASAALDGRYIVPNQVAPDLTTHSGFNIKRARIGVRGNPFPLDNKLNYFLLAEFGNNGITNTDKGRDFVKVTDASITYNITPNHHLRAGLFRLPMGDESIQAIFISPYINYTAVTNQLLLERFLTPGTAPGKANRVGSVGAFRDTGVELFGTFTRGKWEHSYALMYSNGNGIDMNDTDGNRDTTLYWASTWLLGGGKKAFRHEVKAYLWRQDGKRLYNGSNYNRTRQGVGITWFDGRYRIMGEYIEADGMIFNGLNPVCGASSTADHCVRPADSFNAPLTKDRANGWYVDLGYIINPRWDVSVRYDSLDRGTKTPTALREFRNWTLAAQYHFNKKTRLALNYEIRNARAPHAPKADDIVGAFGNRLTVQLQAVF